VDSSRHEPLVVADGVTLNYGRGEHAVTAVRGASFTIEPGERISLVGPSGSGKSSMLHMIAGIESPSAGTIDWPRLGPPSALRPGEVALAFQSAGLLPPLTVIENVALPGLLLGWNEDAAIAGAMAACARFGVANVASKLPEEISGGQAQRAALARAVTPRPRVLLADEPTGQQDRETAGRIMDELLGWAAETGAAVVVATHDPAVGGRFGSRWEISGGRLAVGVGASSR
jgi:predicted ABC-type transport system involved in lysophospholipase L1 biosynthesis ATPase subunit